LAKLLSVAGELPAIMVPCQPVAKVTITDRRFGPLAAARSWKLPDSCSKQNAVTRQNSPLAVVCLSGGMDSTSLLLNLLESGHEVFGMSFRYGQRHEVEIEFLQRNLQYLNSRGLHIRHEIIDLSQLGRLFHSALLMGGADVPLGHYEDHSMRETVVPNRNAIFASLAYGWALSIAIRNDATVKLGLGVHTGDHAIYPDCRPEFYGDLWRAFQTGNWDSERVELFLPYLNSDKAAILRDALRSTTALELDFERVFANTVTSYLPDREGNAHGLTGSDVERILAFHAIGRADPVRYSGGWEDAVRRARELDSGFSGRQKTS
jgi:7-cyano-7-deazaguanine synthase